MRIYLPIKIGLLIASLLLLTTPIYASEASLYSTSSNIDFGDCKYNKSNVSETENLLCNSRLIQNSNEFGFMLSNDSSLYLKTLDFYIDNDPNKIFQYKISNSENWLDESSNLEVNLEPYRKLNVFVRVYSEDKVNKNDATLVIKGLFCKDESLITCNDTYDLKIPLFANIKIIENPPQNTIDNINLDIKNEKVSDTANNFKQTKSVLMIGYLILFILLVYLSYHYLLTNTHKKRLKEVLRLKLKK